MARPIVPLSGGGSAWLSPGGCILMVFVFTSLCYVAVDAWYCDDAADTIRAVCNRCYAGGAHMSGRSRSKRSSLDRIQLLRRASLIKKSNALNFLGSSSHSSNNLLAKRSRASGLIDECCHRRCELREMIFYCCLEVQKMYYAQYPDMFVGRTITS